MKNQPYSKTVVTEVRIQLADLLTRTVLLKSSAAAPILDTDQFNSGDYNVAVDNPLYISEVKNIIVVSSFTDFNVVLNGVAESITLNCKGLFIHVGQLSGVVITPAGPAPIRVQCIVS